MSPRSSSGSRRGRDGLRSCTAPSCTILCADPAISVSMSSPAMPLPAIQFQEDGAYRRGRSVVRPTALFDSAGCGRRGSWCRHSKSALAWHRECRPRVSHGRGRRCGALRPMAVAFRQRCRIALLQFLFLAADLHVHDHRPDQRRGLHLLIIMAVIVSNVAARVRTRRSRRWRGPATPNRSTHSAESSPAPARSTTCSGRPPTRPLDAQGPGGLAAAREWLDRRQVGLSSGRYARCADLAAATWSWENDRPAGRGSDTLPGAKRLFLPMHTGRGAIGIVGIDADKPGPLLTPDQRRLLDALMDQAALAVERVRLVEDLDRSKRTAETDRLRTALLTSISHDLKTPLAAVLGSAGTLRDLAGTSATPRRPICWQALSTSLNGSIGSLPTCLI